MFNLGPFDACVLGLYLIVVVGVGLYAGYGQRNLSDYMLGGRDLPWWALLGSIVATETSTVTFLSVPATAFREGGNLQFIQLALGYVLGRLLVARFLLPLYFRGELFTAYEVLHARFGGATKTVASIMFLVTRTFADGLRLYLTALVLNAMTDWTVTQSVVVLGAVTVVYTMVGGMKSVVWNDCIQLVVYIAGALVAATAVVGMLPGGLSSAADYAAAHAKLRWLDASFDPTVAYTIWAGVIGGMFLTTATHGADQMMVQRYLCARSERDAARAVRWSGPVVLVQFLLFLLLGVGLAAFYDVSPPERPFKTPDEAFVHFIVHHLPAGAKGLTLAALFSAAMSTLASSLNSSATSALNDIILSSKPESRRNPRLVPLGRALTVAFGAAQVGVAIVGERLAERGVVDSVLAIAGFSTGVVLGVFALGMANRRAGQASALVGLLAGLATVTAVAFGTRLAWPWYTLVGGAVTFAAGSAAAWFLPPHVTRRSAGLSSR
ncbi:MAG: sodium/solute symporter [Planctomycetes bacterium]|nr:sodium/solute symporter [Planctomycetota bacterium]